MPILLHVGCGMNRKERTTKGFNTPEWEEKRLDIDPAVKPDIIGTMTDMSAVPSASVDGVFSSHNIEHLYPHEVPVALAEFRRVLRPEGIMVLTCPDLQAIAELVAQDKLMEPAYTSPAGPVSPLDMLYGHRPAMARGNLYMAHRTGFTQRSLQGALSAAGMPTLAVWRQPKAFALWAIASASPRSAGQMQALAKTHFG